MLEVTFWDKLWLVPLAYVVGSIPFGLLIAGFRGIDVESVGSGNIGATNVARALGVPWAVLTGVLDLGKGALPVLLAQALLPEDTLWTTLTGGAAVAGHCASVFLDFRGGKGVATSAGVMLVVAPIPTLFAAAAWGLTMAISRISSLSALVALPTLLILLVLFQPAEPTRWLPLLVLLGGTILWRHKDNVRRLRRGDELGFKS